MRSEFVIRDAAPRIVVRHRVAVQGSPRAGLSQDWPHWQVVVGRKVTQRCDLQADALREARAAAADLASRAGPGPGKDEPTQ